MKELAFPLASLLATGILLGVVLFSEPSEGIPNVFDVRYWRCFLKKIYKCPDNDIKFYMYSADNKFHSKRIDIRSNYALKVSGFNPHLGNVILIHGFNGTHQSTAIRRLRKAYLAHKGHNVFMVDWHELTNFPCYLSSLSNTRLVAQCTAQLYAHIMDMGGLARKTTCIGHSLGAHICGMMSNFLDKKQFKIVGLDPARPLINQFAGPEFKLTRDDAHQVMVVHTNAGLLGETGLIGHVDFCVNGGRTQPGCVGHQIRRSRCSHFQSVCYYSKAVINGSAFRAQPCSTACPKRHSVFEGAHYDGTKSIYLGDKIPATANGQYCMTIDHDDNCSFV